MAAAQQPSQNPRAMFFGSDAASFADDIARYLMENHVENVTGFLEEIQDNVEDQLKQLGGRS